MFESVWFTVATRELLRLRGPPQLWLRVRLSKDPAVFSTFLEDFAAPLGLAVCQDGLYSYFGLVVQGDASVGGMI
jgi:hypothetical protein